MARIKQSPAQIYAAARSNLFLVVAFTLVNLGIVVFGDGLTYFVFSAYVPYTIAMTFKILCGLLPAEYYPMIGMTEADFLPADLFTVGIAAAVVILALYLLCALFSGKGRVGWMVFALVLFIVDTVLLVLDGVSIDTALDILLHAWVLYYLIVGVVSGFKLKRAGN